MSNARSAGEMWLVSSFHAARVSLKSAFTVCVNQQLHFPSFISKKLCYALCKAVYIHSFNYFTPFERLLCIHAFL